MLNIQDVVREMRDTVQLHKQYNPRLDLGFVTRWADALEQAMGEPVGVVEDVIIEAGGAFGDHEIRKARRARWLKGKPPLYTKLFAFPPKTATDNELLPVAKVYVHKTGGNAGIAWSAASVDPTLSLPLLADGTLLYALPPDAAAEIERLKKQREYWRDKAKATITKEDKT
jgi:hypothetical protein